MIQVKQLTKNYGAFSAVKGLSFSIPTGNTLALVGTSGCGKTTTLKMINRLIEPSEGQILIDGEDIMSFPAETIRRRIGYVIQSIGLFPHFTVEENVALVPTLLGWSPDKTQKTVFELLDRLKLDPEKYAGRYPNQLSGGQKQRVGIARALAGDPPIILMDEPFGALDPITRSDIRSDFVKLEELASKTIVIVTHDVEEAFDLADSVCILDKGRIQQIDTPKRLIFQPANDFVRRFLADKLLQLEFHAIQLLDLFESLPKKLAISKNAREIKPNASVFKAMTQLMDISYGQSSIVCTVDRDQKEIDLVGLISAFDQTLAKWKKSKS